MIIETDLKIIKDTCPSKEIKAHSQSFREADRSSDLPVNYPNGKVVKIGRDKASITYYNHLPFAFVPIYSYTVSFIPVQDREGSTGLNKNPDSMIENGYRDYGNQETFMESVREFYKRHAISSSRGTRSREIEDPVRYAQGIIAKETLERKSGEEYIQELVRWQELNCL